jgi:hypothetical protein
MCCYSIYSQDKTIEGEVLNAEMDTPLAYVNIGIANKNIGTVSNVNGKFRLKLNDQISNHDIIIFSHIGFTSKEVIISNLTSKSIIVLLDPKTSDLNEVIVKAKTPKPKKIGRHSKGLGLTHDIYFEKEIEEIAVTIQWVESVKIDKKSKYFSISTSASPINIAFFRDKAMGIWAKSGQSLSFYLNARCN